MKNNLISVIVPVYNAGSYLKDCIDSILLQTMSPFELIIIDDGSTDGSGKICDDYSHIDDRVRVFHQENKGRSAARNKGLDEAAGDYICFVDSDDTVKNDYLERLYEVFQHENAEIVMCDFEATKLQSASMGYDCYIKMNREEARCWLYDQYSRENVLMVVPWNKMYAKELFDGLRYPLGRIHEDEYIIDPLLSRCESVVFIPEKLYMYRDNEAGITAESNKMDIRHLDAVDAFVERIECAVKDNNQTYALVTLRNALYKCARFYRDSTKPGNEELNKAAVTKYKQIYSRYKRLLSIKQRAKYIMFLILPDLFIKVYNA